MFEKLKKKWGIESNFQAVTILIVFTLAGPTVVLLKSWYFDFLGFDDMTSTSAKTIAYLLFIFPAYQILLLLYGFLFGQFQFFWNKQKALAYLIISLGKRSE